MSAQLKTCPKCGATFLDVDWIPARVSGYCSEHCVGPRLTSKQYAIQQSILMQAQNLKLDLQAINHMENE